jgi:hypothetical protein
MSWPKPFNIRISMYVDSHRRSRGTQRRSWLKPRSYEKFMDEEDTSVRDALQYSGSSALQATFFSSISTLSATSCHTGVFVGLITTGIF